MRRKTRREEEEASRHRRLVAVIAVVVAVVVNFVVFALSFSQTRHHPLSLLPELFHLSLAFHVKVHGANERRRELLLLASSERSTEEERERVGEDRAHERVVAGEGHGFEGFCWDAGGEKERRMRGEKGRRLETFFLKL